MRKILSVLFLTVVLLLSGCSQNKEENISPDRQAQNYADQIIECFVNEDTETLWGLFSRTMQDEHELDKEIAQVFDFINGEIVSHDTPEASSGGGIMRGAEGEVSSTFSGWIMQIKTEVGSEYNIYFGGYLKNKDEENNVGLSAVRVRDVALFEEYRDDPDAQTDIGHKNY